MLIFSYLHCHLFHFLLIPFVLVSILNRVVFNASISHTILNDGHRYNTFKTNTYMYLLQKRIKPYIGITSGFALIRREGYDWHTFDKEALLGPSIGLLFEIFVINNLFTNIEFNPDYALEKINGGLKF